MARHRTKRDGGAALLELALVVPVLALVSLGMLALSGCYHTQIRLENAAREGGVYAQLRPGAVTCPDDDDITERVVNEDEGLAALEGFEVRVLRQDEQGRFSVPITGCGTAPIDSGDPIRVEVGAVYIVTTPLVKGVLGSAVPITGSFEVVTQ